MSLAKKLNRKPASVDSGDVTVTTSSKLLDARWHESHRMPRGATLSQRIAWHVVHAKACGCRAMPASIRAALGSEVKPAGRERAPARAKRPKLPKST